ncbi:hypothetical protein OIC43_09195 [Streptomyces sp. NBC_00825]|uniref:hypothetical protein n=1 Tax=unclassified Streptomyces TaxID=2593676 RepID=UPI002ED6477B|nr:hypothetical protein OG832_34505 [Streptomyces sp. NBC_00826]WTH89204.1 hypothetical protein OIC43_09195 [Streptomyces sp. NBC_00825]WTH97929.1 hypothetical protein OHA23_09180 [Streptomyces sp. NBC_00822]
MPEQEVRQFVAHYLCAMALARRRDVKYMVFTVKCEHNPARGVHATPVWQFMEVQRAPAPDRQLMAYFIHRIGVRYFDALQLHLALSSQLRFSSRVAPIEHETRSLLPRAKALSQSLMGAREFLVA